MMRWLCLFAMLAACHKPAQTDPVDMPALIDAQIQLLATYKQLPSPYGWPSDTDCDGALWAGEARASGAAVAIQASIQPDGRPTRRPNGDCPPMESSSTTSTDMRLGQILGLYVASDRATLERLRAYAKTNNYLVGTPREKISAVEMKPAERFFLGQAIAHLGGACDDWCLFPPIYYPAPQTDSDAHLQILQVYMQNLMGIASAETIAAESSLCRTYSDDALAHAVCGDKQTASELILSPAWRLPSYVRGAMPAYAYAHRLLILHILTGK